MSLRFPMFCAVLAIGCGGESGNAATSGGGGASSATVTSGSGATVGTGGGGGGGADDTCEADPSWTHIPIEAPGDHTLVTDTNGGVHLFVRGSGGALTHAELQGGAFAPADELLPNVSTGALLVAADAVGGLHALAQTSSETVYLRRDSAGVWTSEMTGGVHNGADLAVDAALNLHVIRGGLQGPVTYLRRNADGSWLPSFEVGSGEGYPGVAILGQSPLVCFSDGNGYKQCALGAPDGTFPAPTPINEFANYMAMDGTGSEAYLYLNRLHNGATWEADLTILAGTDVTAQEVVEMGTGIGIGWMRGATTPSGSPHPVYVRFVNGGSGDLGLRHARRDGANWQHSWVACKIDQDPPSVAVTSAGAIYIGYQTIVPGQGIALFVATRTP